MMWVVPMASGNDFRVVTRGAENNDSQRCNFQGI